MERASIPSSIYIYKNNCCVRFRETIPHYQNQAYFFHDNMVAPKPEMAGGQKMFDNSEIRTHAPKDQILILAP